MWQQLIDGMEKFKILSPGTPDWPAIFSKPWMGLVGHEMTIISAEIQQIQDHTCDIGSIPIGSMYGIYANIWGIYVGGKCYQI